MRKIKIAHIITKLELGGAQTNTLYTVENLDKTKFTVVLICGKGGILDNDAKKIKNIKLIFLNFLIRKINPIKDILALIELFCILYKEKPDIVHTHSSKAGIIGRWAAFFCGIKCIIHTYHGFGFNNYQKLFVKFSFIFSERLTAIITDKLIAVAKENIICGLKNKIGNFKKYILIRSGIKIKNFQKEYNLENLRKKFNLEHNEKLITTIGPFKPQKNLIDFINVAYFVSKEYKNVKFFIIGDGQERGKIETKIKELNLETKIYLLGWQRDISEILHITDIFVLTSLWEGLPKSVVEAMVSGKSVVCYAVDGIKEIVKNNINGFLIKPKDVNDMSEKILLLLKDDNLRIKFGIQSKHLIGQEFDIDYMVWQQENLYRSIKMLP